MVLKESFTYQRGLSAFVDRACTYLCREDNITKKTQTHMRNKAYSEGLEEVIVTNEKKGDIVIENNKMISFLNALMNEKIALAEAISLAKRNADFDIDAAIESNKLRQKVARTFHSMASVQSKERELDGVDYKWNQEGNQVSYRYPIKEVTTIDFDRNVAKKLDKTISEEADKVSTSIDRIETTLVVEFEPKFDIRDSFEDAYVAYVATLPTNEVE